VDSKAWIGAVAGLLALGAIATAVWVDGPEASSGTFAVRVDGPDGLIWNGTVHADEATAYTVLLEAGRQGGFAVVASGTGDMVFVEAIAGYHYQGAGGWCYAVWTDDAWVHPVLGANGWGLSDGDAVWWHYEDAGCPAG
jgi:hypothetical protein